VSDLILYEGEKKNPDDKQYIGGSEITPFKISPEQKWLRHDYKSFIKGDVKIQVYPGYNEVDRKIVTRQTAHRQDSIIAAVDQSQLYTAKSVHTTILQNENYDIRYVTAILNSRVIDYVYDAASGEQGQTFGQVRLHELRGLPIPKVDFEEAVDTAGEYERLYREYEEAVTEDPENIEVSDTDSRTAIHDCLASLTDDIEQLKTNYGNVNTHLPDYLGSYTNGSSLRDLTEGQPVEGVADTPLTSTTEDYEGLRIKDIEMEESNKNSVILYSTLRYKPENPEKHETDQYGFTTTNQFPTLEFTDVGSDLKLLLTEFVPYVVEVEEKDAGYYSEARKSITPLERLNDIILPNVEEVIDRMREYQQKKNRAEYLAQQIFATDEFINQLIYQLYGISQEDINTIENEVMVELRSKVLKGET
jgi:hypothetical protein